MLILELSVTIENVSLSIDGEGVLRAGGRSLRHRFYEGRHPDLSQLEIYCAIVLVPTDPFETFVENVVLFKSINVDQLLKESRDAKARGIQFCAQLHRYDQFAPVALTFYMPAGPNWVQFLASAAASGRSLSVSSDGWYFSDSDTQPAPCPSPQSFLERREPAFSAMKPLLRLGVD